MEIRKLQRLEGRERRHKRIRKKIKGTADRPRLCVYRSLNHMYAQLINDETGTTLLTVTSRHEAVLAQTKSGGNVKAATAVGQTVAKEAKTKGITKVVFDRGGYLYHGRVKALAEAARKEGLQF